MVPKWGWRDPPPLGRRYVSLPGDNLTGVFADSKLEDI